MQAGHSSTLPYAVTSSQVGPSSTTQPSGPHTIAVDPASPTIHPGEALPRPRVLISLSAPSVSLGIQSGFEWSIEDLEAFIAQGQRESQSFRDLVEDARRNTSMPIAQALDPHAVSTIRLEPDGGRTLLIAAHDASTAGAMKVTVTRLMSDRVISMQLETLFHHYASGRDHARQTIQLAADETRLRSEFGCGVAEARFVAQGLRVMRILNTQAVDALRDLQRKFVIPQGDEHVERFVATVRHPSYERACMEQLLEHFRNAAGPVPSTVEPVAVDPATLQPLPIQPADVENAAAELARKLSWFCEQAAQHQAYRDLSHAAVQNGMAGFSAVDRAGDVKVAPLPDGRMVVELSASLDESHACILLVDAMAEIATPELMAMRSQLARGEYHQPDAARSPSDMARPLLADGHSVGAAEFAMKGLALERARHEKTLNVLVALRRGHLIPEGGMLKDYRHRFNVPEDREDVLAAYLAAWKDAGTALGLDLPGPQAEPGPGDAAR